MNKAYGVLKQLNIDTIKSCGQEADSSAAEMISAMAGGWKSKLIVEAWSSGGVTASSIGLAIAAHHTGGRHVCIVPDEIARIEYKDSMRKHNLRMPEIVLGGFS